MDKKTTSDYELSVSMAVVDFIPVIAFCVNGVLLYFHINSYILGAGVLMCTLAGMCKAGWKLIKTVFAHDMPALTQIFHIMMPLGFAVMILSIPLAFTNWEIVFLALFRMPSLIFTILGCICMFMMMVLAVKMDVKKASANWAEQLINSAAQISFVVAVILISYQ